MPTGSAAVFAAATTASGSGIETLSGAAGVRVGHTVSGVGIEAMLGAGAVALSPFIVMSWGSQAGPPVAGTSSAALASMIATASGSQVIQGVVSASTAPLIASGSASEAISGTAHVASAPSTANGAAQSIGGLAAIALAAQSVSAVGTIGESVVLSTPILPTIYLLTPIAKGP